MQRLSWFTYKDGGPPGPVGAHIVDTEDDTADDSGSDGDGDQDGVDQDASPSRRPEFHHPHRGNRTGELGRETDHQASNEELTL